MAAVDTTATLKRALLRESDIQVVRAHSLGSDSGIDEATSLVHQAMYCNHLTGTT